MAPRQAVAAGVEIAVVIKQLGQVFAALAQWRHGHRHHVDQEIQVLAQCTGSQARFRSMAAGGDDPHIQRHRRAATDPDQFAAAQGIGKQGLTVGLQFGELIQEQGAALGALDQPGLHQAVLLAAQDRGFDLVGGQRRRCQHHERTITARAAGMQPARQAFLADPGFPMQQQRRRPRREFFQLAAHRLHRGAAADRLARPGQLRAQAGVFLAQAAGFQGAVDGQQQLGQGNRFFDEIPGAQARRLDRGLDGAVAGHDHHRKIQPRPGPAFEQAQAVLAGHPDIQQHQAGLLPADTGTGGVGVLGNVNAIALVDQDVLDQVADIGFVVDDEDRASTHARPPCGCCCGCCGKTTAKHSAAAGRPVPGRSPAGAGGSQTRGGRRRCRQPIPGSITWPTSWPITRPNHPARREPDRLAVAVAVGSRAVAGCPACCRGSAGKRPMPWPRNSSAARRE